MICPKCGKETMGIAYCDHCGEKLNSSSGANMPNMGSDRKNRNGIGKNGLIIIAVIAVIAAVAVISVIIVAAKKKKEELNPNETVLYNDAEGKITEEVFDEDDHSEDADYWEKDPEVINMSGWEPGFYGREATLNSGTSYEETIMCYDVPCGVYEAKNEGDSSAELRICMNGIVTEGDKEAWAEVTSIPLEAGKSCEITVDEGYFVTADADSKIVLTLKKAFDESQIFGHSSENTGADSDSSEALGPNSDSAAESGSSIDNNKDSTVSGENDYSSYGDLLDENGNLIENSEIYIDL